MNGRMEMGDFPHTYRTEHVAYGFWDCWVTTEFGTFYGGGVGEKRAYSNTLRQAIEHSQTLELQPIPRKDTQ